MKRFGPLVNDAIAALFTVERRIDPYFRDTFNALFQRPLVDLTQFLIRRVRTRRERRLCEEVVLDQEDTAISEIVEYMSRFLRREYAGGRIAERAGNTKTYGVVRATFEVLPGLDARLRHGVFAEPKMFPAWIRFGGPGPLSPPDVEDVGILSIGIKLMEVSAPTLMEDERETQDFLGISAPTFTTPDVIENVKLQRASLAGTPAFYFLNPFDSHYLDLMMQGLYARMNTNPLEVRYWSCVPSLLGDSRAMKYSIRPCGDSKTRIPWNLPDNWLRQAMQTTLLERDAQFDFLIQLQTHVERMPIEDASIEWPEHLSPFIPVARVTIPRQRFDTPERDRFARQLRFSPWHTVADHRPLGNQNRARRTIYVQLAALRQSMNHETHVEPTVQHAP